MWKLCCDNTEVECEIPQRPTLNVEEIRNEDGTYKVGKTNWFPLKISFPNTPIQWEGQKEVAITLHKDEKVLEKWRFREAKLQGDEIHFTSVYYERP